jgi:diadenosine tetraphosphate (Ap4A) HIT family hydrolase
MSASADCYSCTQNARDDLPPREGVYLSPYWRVAHAFDVAIPGWLVLLTRRHVTALDELTADEAAGLGPLLRALTAALREVTGCQKTYVALFAEAEGFAHVHFHVVPREPGLPAESAGRECSDCSRPSPAARYPTRRWTRSRAR